MANADVIANESPVEIAWREIYGPVAEAQSLIELYRTLDDEVSWACLARGVLARLCEAVENVSTLENRHGRLSLDERVAARTAVGEVQHG